MWELYDALLNGIETEDRIRYVQTGDSWVFLKTASGKMGTAAVQEGRSGAVLNAEGCAEMPLREATGLVKSWDFEKAALGLAAMNSVYNQSARFPDCGEPDAFLRYRGEKARRRGLSGFRL